MAGNWQYLVELYLHFLFDTATSFLGIHLKYMDIVKVQQGCTHKDFIAELFSIEKDSSQISMNKK